VGHYRLSLPTHWGAKVISALLQETAIQADQIDEVILGQVLTAGAGQNPARQAAIEAGLPHSVPCMTINKVCGSGLKSVHLAAQAIKCGDADIIIAGGQENMSMAPHLLTGSRSGKKMGDWQLKDSMVIDGLMDAFNDYHMGVTAENVAKKYNISRQAQDQFAVNSQQKTESARNANKFKDEIVAIEIPRDEFCMALQPLNLVFPKQTGNALRQCLHDLVLTLYHFVNINSNARDIDAMAAGFVFDMREMMR